MIPVEIHGEVTTIDADATVTLIEGRSFCLSGRSGDIEPGHVHGLYVVDTRALSRWELRINGSRVEGLAVETLEPYATNFIGRCRPFEGHADAMLVVTRQRHVGRGMRERIVVESYATEPVEVTLELRCDADLAGVFDVKNGTVPADQEPEATATPDTLIFTGRDAHRRTAATVSLSPGATTEPRVAVWTATVQPRTRWEVCAEVSITFDDDVVPPKFRCGQDAGDAGPSLLLASWRAATPTVTSSDRDFDESIARSLDDLGTLRMFDPDDPDTPIVAAGAPWYMTLFGRDSLLTAWMALVADHSLVEGVLRTLGRLQGTKVDPRTEEEPGKILHEVRPQPFEDTSLADGEIYYGTIDATPLYVMLLAEAARWGMPIDTVRQLIGSADRALEWCETFGDRDGDGYLEYRRSGPDGLVNQGWKDSWDSIRFADGRFAEPPIALAEVQGYLYAAYTGRAELADLLGDPATAASCRDRANRLRERFNRDFWLDGEGTFALALDGDKRPVDAVASNAGHCLWTGIAEPDRAESVARRLLAPDLFSGWGVRTLSTQMAASNPVSYHNGSVWPHDNAIVAAGLARYGCLDGAHRVIRAQLDAGRHFGQRLPELFAGFDRDDVTVPTSYPSSCSPQAWAAAAPLLWLRTILGLGAGTRPDGDAGVDGSRLELPDWLDHVEVHGIRLPGGFADLRADAGTGEVEVRPTARH